ncbi:MAG: cell division protein FtsZ [Dongiaceae bacterium]
MTLNISLPNTDYEIKPRITVIGVGGAGGNAVNNMILSSLEGVEFIVANTDAQALTQSQCSRRIQLGNTITQGLGAGSRPDVGRAAAEESIEQVIEHLAGSNMVFITAGMGGGTGTGAAPVLARAAREHGILTVGVVTKPFHFEGVHRMRLADGGIQELAQYVDTLIIIPNQNLFRIANEKTTFADAFSMADQVLYSGVRGVTDLMVMPGLINLDFADIRTVMSEMGKAMMGTGEGEGERRAVAAAEAAISNPLLDDVSMKGARGVLINITGGPDMTLFEVDEAATRIREEVDPEANIIFGSTFDHTLTGKIRISVVATGIEAAAQAQPRPVGLSLVAKGGRVVTTPAREPAEATAVRAGALMPEPQPAVMMAGGGMTAGAMAAPALRQPEPAYMEPVVAERAETVAAAQPRPAITPPVREPAMAQPAMSPPAAAPVAAQPVPQHPWVAPRPAEDRPFVATAPVEPAPRLQPQPHAAPAVTSHAMTAPAPQPQRQTEPRRPPNLFTRVTSGVWPRGSAAAKIDPVEPVQRPQMPEPAPRATAPVQAPVAQAPRVQAPASAAPVQPAEPQIATQQRLTGLDAKDRLAASRAEEELFEIPAFLRRQAN